MAEKIKVAKATPLMNPGTNVHSPKDFTKLLDYFRYKTATSLDAMFDTGILRNSITWYIGEAERMGLLLAVFKAKDSHTGRMAKHYSSDPQKWEKPPQNEQLELFGKEGDYGL